MGALRADRVWMIAGATVTVLLVVACWFLLISPNNAAKDDVENQTADTQTQLITLNKRISELKKKQANLKALMATRDAKQTALPSGSGMAAFLNQLNRSGAATGVTVTGISIGAPVQQVNPSTVRALPITLTADGTLSELEKFLDTLQTGQARAVLIQSAGVTPKSGADADDDSSTTSASPATSAAADPVMSISLSLKAFVTSTTGTSTTVTTK